MPMPSAPMPAPAALARRLQDDAVKLPMLPAVLLRLSAMSPEAPSYFDEVRALVRSDPGLAVKLLRMANSVGGGALNASPSIDMALIRIGARNAVERLLADQAMQMFPARDQWQRDLWEHSVLAAHYMRRLAPMVIDAQIDAEQAYLAGLLHDVGRFLMFSMLPDAFEIVEQRAADPSQDLLEIELRTCGCTHTQLAYLALNRWGMPEALALAARDHHRGEAGRGDCPTDADAGPLLTLLRDVDWLALSIARHGLGWLEQSAADFDAQARNHLRSRLRGDSSHLLARLRAATQEAQVLLQAIGVVASADEAAAPDAAPAPDAPH